MRFFWDFEGKTTLDCRGSHLPPKTQIALVDISQGICAVKKKSLENKGLYFETKSFKIKVCCQKWFAMDFQKELRYLLIRVLVHIDINEKSRKILKSQIFDNKEALRVKFCAAKKWLKLTKIPFLTIFCLTHHSTCVMIQATNGYKICLDLQITSRLSI